METADGGRDAFTAHIDANLCLRWVSLSGIDGQDSSNGIGVTPSGKIFSSGYRKIAATANSPSPMPAASGRYADYLSDGVPRRIDEPRAGPDPSIIYVHHLLEWNPKWGHLKKIIDTPLSGGSRSITLLSDSEVFLAGASVGSRFNFATGKIVFAKKLPWTTLGTAIDQCGRLYVTGAFLNKLDDQRSRSSKTDAFLIRFGSGHPSNR